MKLRLGLKASRKATFTPESVETYARLTGDFNPLHFDSGFASGTRFGALIVQGGLTTGIIHAIVAMEVPGPGSVFLSQDWKFTAPVYVGDTVTATVEIVHVHETKPVTQLHVTVIRADGETVLEGEAWCYTFVSS